MLGYMIIFIAGGIAGCLGTALLTCSSKLKLIGDRSLLARRLDFLEREGEIKRFKPVRDPRLHVTELTN